MAYFKYHSSLLGFCHNSTVQLISKKQHVAIIVSFYTVHLTWCFSELYSSIWITWDQYNIFECDGTLHCLHNKFQCKRGMFTLAYSVSWTGWYALKLSAVIVIKILSDDLSPVTIVPMQWHLSFRRWITPCSFNFHSVGSCPGLCRSGGNGCWTGQKQDETENEALQHLRHDIRRSLPKPGQEGVQVTPPY